MKKILCLLVAISMVLALTSCQEQGTQNQKDGHISCDECGELNVDSNKFCSKCGSEIINNDIIVCAACGTSFSNTNNYCTSCGCKSDAKIETYTVNVKRKNGTPIKDANVNIYEDKELTILSVSNRTNEYGIVTFDLINSKDYYIAIQDMPKGYIVSESYKFDRNKADIILDTNLIDESEIESMLGEGDIMYDFTFTTITGETMTLSHLLENKELVILEFYMKDSTYCKQQILNMESVYEKYNDSIEILSLGETYGRGSDPVAFLNSETFIHYQLPISGYPASLYIDKEGVIVAVELGTTDVERIEEIVESVLNNSN